MPLRRPALIAFAAVTGGCALLHPIERPVYTGTAELFVDQATFDGEDLTARVLIRARGGDLMVQQDLRGLLGLTVEEARDCETGARVPIMEFVVLADPDKLNMLVRVLDAHWFGVDARIPVYAKQFVGGQPPPECMDMMIVWWMPHSENEPSRPVRTFVRVHTQHPEAGEPDAGATDPTEVRDHGL